MRTGRIAHTIRGADMELTGRTILLTGASRGLGALLAVRLATKHPHLVLTARDERRLDLVRERCVERGARVTALATDVSRQPERERLMRAAGDVDILINNAAIERNSAVSESTEMDVQAQIATNLVAPIELTRLVLPVMLRNGRGIVVNVSSMAGKVPEPYNAVYTATKFGLCGFTATLQLELEGTGVHVGTVCPSFVGETGMWADSGLRAPALMPEVSPERVIQAVLQVIAGAREVLVTPMPARPLLVLREIAPGLDSTLLRILGVVNICRRHATLSSAQRRAEVSQDATGLQHRSADS